MDYSLLNSEYCHCNSVGWKKSNVCDSTLCFCGLVILHEAQHSINGSKKPVEWLGVWGTSAISGIAIKVQIKL